VLARVTGVPGRPHIAAVLMERNPGRFETMQQVFDEYLGAGKKAHMARPFSLTVAQAIALVKNAGGVPVLAHPGVYSGIDPIAAVRNAHAAGLEGVEVFYPYGGPDGGRWVARIEALARELGLLQSGGTDFHGRAGESVDVGDVGLTPRQFAALKTGWQQLRSKRPAEKV